MQNDQWPPVAQAFRPAGGHRAALKGCATFNKARRAVWFRLVVTAWLSAALGTIACGAKSGGEEVVEPPEVPTITADVGKVTRRPVVDDLVVRGTITAVPNEDVKVSALVAGRVNAVTVAEGDTVRQGQVIAELDRQPLVDQRRQAAAAVEQARAQVENARLNLQRNQQLFERGIAAGKEVEDARTQVAAAQAGLEQAQASLSTADRNIERALVRSPIAGQVVKRMVSVGEQVDGTSAQPIAQVANTDRVELAANVPSEYLPRVKVGQTATLTTDASEPDAITGSVLAIAPAVDPATNAGLVRIRITNTGRALKIGMFAEAHVTLDRHDALVVPPSALVRTADTAAVYVVTGDIAQRTEVKTGIEKPDAVEILSGVTEGQTVLVSSVYGLGDKAKLSKPGAAPAQKPDQP
jgi:membrane fusion protein (multidrug efflux system)